MNPNRAYWAAHCAAFSDGRLRRFINETDRLRDHYATAQQAAEAEARYRNLIKEKAALAGGQSTLGRKQP